LERDFLDFGKEIKMADESQNPGRKWRELEKEDDGDKHFDSYRYTPFTTDLEFFRDPNIYETGVARTTQEGELEPGTLDRDKAQGTRRSDGQIKSEIETLLREHRQVDSSDIQVDVQEGVVTLSGRVSSPAQIQAAAGIAENVFGILEVRNQLTIRN
jgi:hypothetical protein